MNPPLHDLSQRNGYFVGSSFSPSPASPATWHCAARHCTSRARTVDAATPMHPCAEMGGAMIPLIRDDDPRRHWLVPQERQDYVGSDLVQPVAHRGRLLMAVSHRTDDSQSTTVFAPTATADARAVTEAIEEARDG